MTTSADLLDRAFQAIMIRMVQTGRAPEHDELAAGLGVDAGKARDVLHDIMATGYPGWLVRVHGVDLADIVNLINLQTLRSNH